MATETIICPECGFKADYVSFGRRGKMNTDFFLWARTCKQKPPAGNPVECPVFNKEIERPRPA